MQNLQSPVCPKEFARSYLQCRAGRKHWPCHWVYKGKHCLIIRHTQNTRLIEVSWHAKKSAKERKLPLHGASLYIVRKIIKQLVAQSNSTHLLSNAQPIANKEQWEREGEALRWLELLNRSSSQRTVTVLYHLTQAETNT